MFNSFTPQFPPRWANGPYAERADANETPADRWLAAAYSRWLMPSRLFKRQAGRFADRVDSLEREFKRKSDAGLALDVAILSARLRRHGLQEQPVAEAFALARELSARLLGKRHYRVQVIGGWAMIQGRVAEMDTGEGKTLAATLPAAVAAMAGIPTHILTVNDYLAKRDAEEMAPLYHAMGCSVGVIHADLTPEQRRLAYAADITYCTNKDIGFDYLRDRISLKDWPSESRMTVSSMVNGLDQTQGLVLRGLYFGIVDEADSILIDEARTPLIISATSTGGENQGVYLQALAIGRQLQMGEDFEILPEDRSVRLTGRGKARVASMLHQFSEQAGPAVARMDKVVQALSALHLYEKDKQYIVVDGTVQIVDEFTGRVMPDRSWEQGLHQLIEAKEGCELTGQRKTLARITYQRLFCRYLRLAGMTGTASEVADELWAVYRLKVSHIPPHRPRQRKKLPTRRLRNRSEKWQAVVESVCEQAMQKGRPVLVGTRSVEASEELSQRLTQAGIEHQVLNARQDSEEASLIAQAGQRGIVTVATNMAGRGTDIKLGEGVAELGGLHVILTEFHESGRIDRQLFGRSGRQGDPGSHQSIVAEDDELFKVFLPSWARHLPMPRRQSAWANWLWRVLAQSRAESHHAGIRKQTLDMDQRIDHMLSFAGKE